MKIIILGAGLVGGPMAEDLAQEGNFSVTTADINPDALNKLRQRANVATLRKDLGDPGEVKSLVKDFDMVVNAVPGFMGFQTLQAVIEAGKNVVDIAFYPEDPFLLDSVAKENGVTAIVDCGVAPGMSNVLIGHLDSELDQTVNVEIYVGGLPEVRRWPYEYKAVFSPLDVIEEYTRPARYVENGVLVTRPALSDPEYVDFPGIGTLEAFNSDGLRTLARTIDAPNLKEKTLRYPGHIQKMAVLRETGFFSREEIEIQGVKIRPLDFTAKLLFPGWELKEGEVDVTVLQVIVEGKKDGRKVRYTYDMLDRYDKETGIHSMARTTGYTATAAVRLLAQGLFTRKGICPPEFIGKEKQCTDFMLAQLAQKGIHYRQSIIDLSQPTDQKFSTGA